MWQCLALGLGRQQGFPEYQWETQAEDSARGVSAYSPDQQKDLSRLLWSTQHFRFLCQLSSYRSVRSIENVSLLSRWPCVSVCSGLQLVLGHFFLNPQMCFEWFTKGQHDLESDVQQQLFKEKILKLESYEITMNGRENLQLFALDFFRVRDFILNFNTTSQRQLNSL